jgi:hypothetical protein
MRTIVLFIIIVVAGVASMGLQSAKAVPLSGVAAPDAQSKSALEEVGWRRRWYRGYGYPAPYAYYPPAYTYYPPPPPPVYYAPAYPAYPYYRPYGYYRPYYAPY